MNPAPQENQPGEANEPIRFHKWTVNRPGEERCVGEYDYDRERAKRLAVEKELAETDGALLTANLKCNEYGVRMDKAERELLELRAKVGGHKPS